MAHSGGRVLGANDRVRLRLIGTGSRDFELLKQVVAVPGTEAVAVANVYTRRLDEARQVVPGIRTVNDHRQLLKICAAFRLRPPVLR